MTQDKRVTLYPYNRLLSLRTHILIRAVQSRGAFHSSTNLHCHDSKPPSWHVHSNKYSLRANITNTSTNERCTVTRYNRMYRVNTMIQLVDSVVVPSLQLDQWCVLSGWQSARFSCWTMPVSTGFQTSFVCPVWILWLQSSLLPYCYFTDWENVESRVKSAGGDV